MAKKVETPDGKVLHVHSWNELSDAGKHWQLCMWAYWYVQDNQDSIGPLATRYVKERTDSASEAWLAELSRDAGPRAEDD